MPFPAREAEEGWTHSGSGREIHPGAGSQTTGEAEANVVVPVFRTVVVPVGRPAVYGIIVPTAPALDAVRTRGDAHG
jgi:hypothetical protein